MKVTALEEYGLRCLMRVVEHGTDDPISAASVAEAEGLSVPYTQKLLRILSNGGLVESKKGPSGGYYFAKSTSDVAVGDVIRVLDGFIEVSEFCSQHTGKLDICKNECNCSIRPVWSHISDYIMSMLDNIPLAVLLRDEGEVRTELERMYTGMEAPQSAQKAVSGANALD